MNWRALLHSWPERLYSLPTLKGLIPMGLTAFAGYQSFSSGSALHQWLVVTMSIFMILHLIDSSRSLRTLKLTPDPDQTIYSGIPRTIPLLPEKGFSLDVHFEAPGVLEFPKKRIDEIAPSGLFRFWRTLQFEERAFVLPAPIDQGVSLEIAPEVTAGDPDSLNEIRDPRLRSLRDEKIFIKTGRSLQRVRSSDSEATVVRLLWSRLEHLPLQAALEQLSFWIKTLESQPRVGFGPGLSTLKVQVELPFFESHEIESKSDLRRLKEALARRSAL